MSEHGWIPQQLQDTILRAHDDAQARMAELAEREPLPIVGSTITYRVEPK